MVPRHGQGCGGTALSSEEVGGRGDGGPRRHPVGGRSRRRQHSGARREGLGAAPPEDPEHTEAPSWHGAAGGRGACSAEGSLSRQPAGPGVRARLKPEPAEASDDRSCRARLSPL